MHVIGSNPLVDRASFCGNKVAPPWKTRTGLRDNHVWDAIGGHIYVYEQGKKKVRKLDV